MEGRRLCREEEEGKTWMSAGVPGEGRKRKMEVIGGSAAYAGSACAEWWDDR